MLATLIVRKRRYSRLEILEEVQNSLFCRSKNILSNAQTFFMNN